MRKPARRMSVVVIRVCAVCHFDLELMRRSLAVVPLMVLSMERVLRCRVARRRGEELGDELGEAVAEGVM